MFAPAAESDADLLTAAVGEAARLLDCDGAMIYLYDEVSGELRFAYDAGITSEDARRMLQDLRLPIGRGLYGTSIERRELTFTNDYAADARFSHHPVADQIVAAAKMRSMAAAPMFADEQPLGVLGAFCYRPHGFNDQQLTVLRSLADHAAAAIDNRRLLRELRSSEERFRDQAAELARTLTARQALDDIARRIVDVPDSAEVLQEVVDVASGLLGSDGAHLTLMNDDKTILVPMVMAGQTEPSVRSWLRSQRFPVGGGINGLSAQLGEVIWTRDYRADPRWPHDPEDDSPDRLELGAVAVAPLKGPGADVIGTLAITYRAPRDIDPRDVALLEELSRQASIAARNSKLYADLRERTETLNRMVEARQTLSEIAVQISSIRDPHAVVQRTMDEAVRLLHADAALVNMLSEDGTHLEPATAFSAPHYTHEDATYELAAGVSGRAIAEQRVMKTGNYLEDKSLKHTPELDELVRSRNLKSVMAAPLIGPDGPIGTLTVDSKSVDAFTDDDAALLGALAAQAATAIANAGLYEQLEQSERRYRHLVDHSPDLVWAVDVEGRMTYVGDAIARMTGYEPARVLGRYWVSLLMPESMSDAEAAWRAIRQRPDEEQRFRVLLPLEAGGSMPAEINMIGNVVDREFAGANGSLRDITERERLEEDLRRRSAELAANEERASLARELHDSVTQALFSMGLTLRTIELLLDRDPAAARAKFDELRELQNDALAEMRTLIFELRPRGLEIDGLTQALRNHAAAVSGRTGLTIGVDSTLDERLSLDTEQALYRIAQEALHNVVKHANAKSARVILKRNGDEVELAVEDDGAGFDLTRVSGTKLGLIAMRQRAERLGGRMEVHSREGRGTRVTITLPDDGSQLPAADASIDTTADAAAAGT
jgi:PAS domain S-box-containing protein